MLCTPAKRDANTCPAPTLSFFSAATFLATIFVTLVLVALATHKTEAANISQAETQCPQTSPQTPVQSATQNTAQSVWIISTRNASRCNPCDVAAATLEYWRMEIDEGGCRRWLPADEDEFHASAQPKIPTCFHIHGNRTSHNEASSEGLCVLKCLKKQANGQQLRMVIWSWPSMRIQGPNRKDARIKAARSDVQAYHFARFVRRLDPDTRVGMVGYSFGARIITGALEMLAGGCIAGRHLDMQEESNEPTTSGNLPEIRIVLVASASDRCWLLPGRRHGSALDLTHWALITCNDRDPVLRWYPKMYGCSGPQATGFTGPALTYKQRQKTEVVNLSCAVGKSHDWQRYLCSSRLYWRLGECVFVEE